MADNENKRVLASAVYAAGQWWKAGSTPPDDVAEKITNPKAWTDAPDESAKNETDTKAGTASGARLVRRVAVAGKWYGPDDEIPDDVARQIRNPKVWEGGELPELSPNPEPSKDDRVETPSTPAVLNAGERVTPADETDEDNEPKGRRPRRT